MSKRSGIFGLQRDRNVFEVAILVTAISMVAAIIAGLIIAGIGGGGPVDLSVKVVKVRTLASGDVVDVRIRNTGGATAESVVIRVRADDEEREITVPMVAKQDEEEASVVVPSGSGANARAEVIGYAAP